MAVTASTPIELVEGVYARYVAGAMGDRGDPSAFDFFGQQVVALAEAASNALDRSSG